MDDGEAPTFAATAEHSSKLGGPRILGSVQAGDVQLYRFCEDLTEPLVYAALVFSPWAYGTTQPWSIWTMNIAGYVLGLLLLTKLVIRWGKGYRPSRWDQRPAAPERPSAEGHRLRALRLMKVLAVFTAAILAFCLTSAINARATYQPHALLFEYHPCVTWLPHSLDSHRTWQAFWNYLALGCLFWAVQDWLLGKSGSEVWAQRQSSVPGSGGAGPLLPTRLRRLLWVLALNGGILGLEGIVQRLARSDRLLFLVQPRVNPDAVTQFGPYAYRANAAQYFNLLWPVCVGFWWMLQRSRRPGRPTHHLVLVCGMVMAACPIISTSRAGAFVAIAILGLAAVLLPAAHFLLPGGGSGGRWSTATALSLFFSAALALGLTFGWKSLAPRLGELQENFEGREQMYDSARPMVADYPLFGTGPGTFETVFQLYRISTQTYWPAQLHNDWLETRITFGWLGSGLIAAAFLTVLVRWFAPGGIHGGRRFMLLVWLALGGCLVHARFDFPFQVYSILVLFLIWCAVLVNLTRRA